MATRAHTKTEAAYLLSERRKDEMLSECLEAFDALYNAETSHNWLKLKGVHNNSAISRVYAPSPMVGHYMSEKLRAAGVKLARDWPLPSRPPMRPKE